MEPAGILSDPERGIKPDRIGLRAEIAPRSLATRNGRSPIQRFASSLALAALLLVQLVVSSSWMWRYGFFERPPAGDAAWYRIDALRMERAYENGGIPGWIRAGVTHDRDHPPVLPMLCGLLSAAEGSVSPRACFATIALFGLLFTAGVFRLARNVIGPWQALAVAAVTSSCPVIAVNLRPFYPQFPMTALTIWALDALVRSQAFAHRGWSLACGAWAGLATMTKMLAPLYLAGSVGVALFVALRRREDRRGTLVRIAGALALALVLTLPWYVNHVRDVLQYTGDVVGSEGQHEFSNDIPLRSLERWTYYLRTFASTGLGLPLFLVTLAAVALARPWRTWTEPSRKLVAWILAAGPVAAYPILTIGQTSSGAFYVMGFVPLAVLLLVRSIEFLPNHGVRRALAACVLFATAWNAWLVYCSPDRNWSDDRLVWLGFELRPRADVDLARFATDVGAHAEPGAEKWPNEEFARLMTARVPGRNPRMAAIHHPGFDHPFAGAGPIDYEMKLLGRGIEWSRLPPASGPDDPALKAAILSRDFLLVDHRALSLEDGRKVLDRLGVPYEVIATREVTRTSALSLVAIGAR